MVLKQLLQLTAVISVVFFGSTNAAEPQFLGPNVLWIYVEDMNDWMGAYGDDTVPTPNIDQLASAGVRFDSAIMPAPVCSATRSAIITGSLQTSLGTHNHRSSRDDKAQIQLPAGYKTVPELFREHGYVTFNMGKDDYNFEFDRDQLYSKNPVTPELLAKRERIRSNGGVETHGAYFDLDELLKDKPFFGQIQLAGGKHSGKATVIVAPDSVHLPPYYPDHRTFREVWARHYEQIAITDLEVGRILKDLEDNGLLGNTIVLFFTDHGMVLPRHKQYLYEGGIKVPLIIHWPVGNDRLRKKGTVRADIVNGIDIGTTSLSLAGINVPEYMEGDDIFGDGYQEKPYTIAARDRCDYTFDRIRSVRTQHFKYIRNFRPELPYLQPQYRDNWPNAFPFMAAYKEMYWAGHLTDVQAAFGVYRRPDEELYDLRKDPHEIRNLVQNPDFQNELRRNRAILEDWILATDDKGQYPESDAAVLAMMRRFPNKCINERCELLRKQMSADH